MSRSGKILAVGGVVIASIIGTAIFTSGVETSSAPIAAGDSLVKELRFSMSSNTKHPIYAGATKFKELVEASTDLVVKIYPSAQLGDDRAAIEMLQLGTLDVSIPSTAPLANFYPEYNIFDLPFLISSEEVADKVLRGPFADDMLKLLASKKLKGLDFWENGFRHLTNSTREVTSLEDVKGLKIRTMESPLHLDAWNALGATPTPMAFNELFTALQQGTVDGQENPYPNIALNNLFEVQKYISDTGHVYSPLALIFSSSTWGKLNASDQEAVQAAAIGAGNYQREVNRKINNDSLTTINDTMKITTLTPEVREGFREATSAVVDKYRDVIGSDLIDTYLAEIEAAETESAE